MLLLVSLLLARQSAGRGGAPRIKEGGLDAAFFSIYMPGTITGPEAVKRSLILIDHVRSLAEQHPNEIVLATTAAEVRAAHKAGKFAALMGMEGGHMIDDSLAVLRDYQRLGVRYLTLSHSVNTNWSDSSGDTPKHNGLTDFGKDVVRELNRLGMLVDISHVSDKTFWDALETSKAPLVASHSSSLRSISGHPRNMTDEMIRALGAKGGVIMINYARPSSTTSRRASTRRGLSREDAAKMPPRPTVSWEKIVEHIDHAAKLVGAARTSASARISTARRCPTGWTMCRCCRRSRRSSRHELQGAGCDEHPRREHSAPLAGNGRRDRGSRSRAPGKWRGQGAAGARSRSLPALLRESAAGHACIHLELITPPPARGTTIGDRSS